MIIWLITELGGHAIFVVIHRGKREEQMNARYTDVYIYIKNHTLYSMDVQCILRV